MGKRDKSVEALPKNSRSATLEPRMKPIAGPGKQASIRQRPDFEALVLRKISNANLTVDNLVEELSKELGYKSDKTLAGLMELNSKSKIRLVEARPFLSLASYAFSATSLWFWALLVAALFSFGLIFVSAGVGLYLRYVFGSLLVLFLPGYSFVELMYAKKNEVDNLARLGLSIGLSIAISSLVALFLNFTPLGVSLIPVASSLLLLTIAFSVLALRRKHAYYKLLRDVV